MQNARITRIHHADLATLSVLGLYTEQKVLVYGQSPRPVPSTGSGQTRGAGTWRDSASDAAWGLRLLLVATFGLEDKSDA